MANINFKLLKKELQKRVESAENLEALNEVLKEYSGKQGKLICILRSLENLPKAKRAKVGKEANAVKNLFKVLFEKKEKEIKEKMQKIAIEKEWLDVTIPGEKISIGHLNPLTLAKRRAQEIFQSMGFSIVEGPNIETEWYHFDALNIPKDHPARDAWSTFWLKGFPQKLLLRAHTSPAQIRFMEKNQPPLRIIVPGEVFRYEATDASHEFDFYQLEGLMAGKDISAANFKAVIEGFYSKFFAKEVKVRFIPSFFPFTEPSFQVDMSCINCGGKGCSACKQSGWLEMMGAGMVHPNVFKYSGLNPKGLTGFAFGMGMERLAMMKYKINEIRMLRSGDLRFLNQF